MTVEPGKNGVAKRLATRKRATDLLLSCWFAKLNGGLTC